MDPFELEDLADALPAKPPNPAVPALALAPAGEQDLEGVDVTPVTLTLTLTLIGPRRL